MVDLTARQGQYRNMMKLTKKHARATGIVLLPLAVFLPTSLPAWASAACLILVAAVVAGAYLLPD